MSEQNNADVIEIGEPIAYEEPVRHYAPLSSGFMLDWNKLLYTVEEEDGFQLDWNRLIYNDEQIEEFNRQKKEKLVRPNMFEYITKAPCERSDIELFFLKQAGFCIDDENQDDWAEYDRITSEENISCK